MTSKYAPLHNHTEYSILDGMSGIGELVAEATRLELPALSLTDHGSLGGAYKFYRECLTQGIKPIIGIEAYASPASRTLRKPTYFGSPEQRDDDVGGAGKYTHLTLFSTGSEGLRSLYRLQSDSYTHGFYGKPRVDLDSLAGNKEGVVCTSGCVGGTVATRLRLGQYGEARQHLSDLKDIFGDALYVEIMRHDIEIEKKVESDLLRLSVELQLPIVATTDSHYTTSSQADIHDSLLCIQTRALKATPPDDRFAFQGSGYHLQSADEFRARFSDLRGGVDSTLEIAERIGSYEGIMDGSNKLPQIGDYDDDELTRQVQQFIQVKGLGPTYSERAAYELDLLRSRGFSGYFLMVAHIMREGRSRGIRYGPARGSAGGSLVAFALGITEIDPIHYGLLFERFLNPEREGLPDIDVDVDQGRRDEHVSMVRELYGDLRVCQVSTYGTIKAKAAIRDTVRINGLPFALGGEITRQLPPPRAGRQPSLSELPVGAAPPEVLSTALGLEGRIRSMGTHPGAIVVGPPGVELDSIVPVIRPGGKGYPTTAYDLTDVENLGLLKTDWLGLATLGVIDECLRLLQARFPERSPLPTTFDDPDTFALLSAGDTTGCFQLDSSGMRSLLRKLRPTTFLEIAALLALFRPGPMGADAHNEYANRKNGRSRVVYPHREFESSLEPCLSDTYGLIVFQEQVLEVLRVVGGYTYGTAGLIFDAMRKKDTAKMLSALPDFQRRLKENGYSGEATSALWGTLVPFSDYSFGRAHSVGYATVAYQTAYLKRHHPREWMAALLTIEDDPDKQIEYIKEAIRWSIPILPPDVNDSGFGWTLTPEGLRVGFNAVKGIADSTFSSLRKSRPYLSLEDFLSRVDSKLLNVGVFTSLVKSGSFDKLVPDREGLLSAAESITQKASAAKDSRVKGQTRLYSGSTYTFRKGKRSNARRQSMELETVGLELTPNRVTLTANPNRWLTETELAFIKSVIQRYPGIQPVDLKFGLTTMTGVGSIGLSEKARGSLLSLGAVTVEEES